VNRKKANRGCWGRGTARFTLRKRKETLKESPVVKKEFTESRPKGTILAVGDAVVKNQSSEVFSGLQITRKEQAVASGGDKGRCKEKRRGYRRGHQHWSSPRKNTHMGGGRGNIVIGKGRVAKTTPRRCRKFSRNRNVSDYSTYRKRGPPEKQTVSCFRDDEISTKKKWSRGGLVWGR